MSDKSFRIIVAIILSVFTIWVIYQFGYVRGYADACRWCTEMYQEN